MINKGFSICLAFVLLGFLSVFTSCKEDDKDPFLKESGAYVDYSRKSVVAYATIDAGNVKGYDVYITEFLPSKMDSSLKLSRASLDTFKVGLKGLDGGTLYNYRIRIDGRSVMQSDVRSFTTPFSPIASNVEAVKSTEGGSVKVRTTVNRGSGDNAFKSSNFTVTVALQEGNTVTFKDATKVVMKCLDTNTQNYEVTLPNLTGGKTYTYTVVVVTGMLKDCFSDTLQFTAETAPEIKDPNIVIDPSTGLVKATVDFNANGLTDSCRVVVQYGTQLSNKYTFADTFNIKTTAGLIECPLTKLSVNTPYIYRIELSSPSFKKFTTAAANFISPKGPSLLSSVVKMDNTTGNVMWTGALENTEIDNYSLYMYYGINEYTDSLLIPTGALDYTFAKLNAGVVYKYEVRANIPNYFRAVLATSTFQTADPFKVYLDVITTDCNNSIANAAIKLNPRTFQNYTLTYECGISTYDTIFPFTILAPSSDTLNAEVKMTNLGQGLYNSRIRVKIGSLDYTVSPQQFSPGKPLKIETIKPIRIDNIVQVGADSVSLESSITDECDTDGDDLSFTAYLEYREGAGAYIKSALPMTLTREGAKVNVSGTVGGMMDPTALKAETIYTFRIVAERAGYLPTYSRGLPLTTKKAE